MRYSTLTTELCKIATSGLTKDSKKVEYFWTFNYADFCSWLNVNLIKHIFRIIKSFSFTKMVITKRLVLNYNSLTPEITQTKQA